jgi:hypothetical protein
MGDCGWPLAIFGKAFLAGAESAAESDPRGR